jgi:hypothetical protein
MFIKALSQDNVNKLRLKFLSNSEYSTFVNQVQ